MSGITGEFSNINYDDFILVFQRLWWLSCIWLYKSCFNYLFLLPYTSTYFTLATDELTFSNHLVLRGGSLYISSFVSFMRHASSNGLFMHKIIHIRYFLYKLKSNESNRGNYLWLRQQTNIELPHFHKFVRTLIWWAFLIGIADWSMHEASLSLIVCVCVRKLGRGVHCLNMFSIHFQDWGEVMVAPWLVKIKCYGEDREAFCLF